MSQPMEREIALLANIRRAVEAATRELPPQALTAVPPGFNNSVLWNVGHLVVTQQLLCYKLAGLPMEVDEAALGRFAKGTSPAGWSGDIDPAQDYETQIAALHRLAARLGEDYRAGRFTSYQPYTTSTGFEIASIDDAIRFNNFHEGVHVGAILALKRAVA